MNDEQWRAMQSHIGCSPSLCIQRTQSGVSSEGVDAGAYKRIGWALPKEQGRTLSV